MPAIPAFLFLLLYLGLGASSLVAQMSPKDSTSGIEATLNAAPPTEKKPVLTDAAKQRLRHEFNQVRQSAELPDWQKIDASKLPAESASPEDKVQFKRKLLELLEFCREERFQALSDVDELDYLTASDKQVCKDRLKLLNPFIE